MMSLNGDLFFICLIAGIYFFLGSVGFCKKLKRHGEVLFSYTAGESLETVAGRIEIIFLYFCWAGILAHKAGCREEAGTVDEERGVVERRIKVGAIPIEQANEFFEFFIINDRPIFCFFIIKGEAHPRYGVVVVKVPLAGHFGRESEEV